MRVARLVKWPEETLSMPFSIIFVLNLQQCSNFVPVRHPPRHCARFTVFAVQMCLRSAAWNPSLRFGLDLSLVFSLVLRLVLSLDLGLPLSLTLGLALTPALSLPLSALFRAPVKVSKGL